MLHGEFGLGYKFAVDAVKGAVLQTTLHMMACVADNNDDDLLFSCHSVNQWNVKETTHHAVNGHASSGGAGNLRMAISLGPRNTHSRASSCVAFARPAKASACLCTRDSLSSVRHV
eukprot:6207805-Pleurochrysis_carterae.AAC.4